MQIAYFIGTPKFPFSWSSLYASYLYLFLATPHHLSAALVPPSVSASINIHCMAGEPVHTLTVAAASLHFIPASFDLRRTAILFDLFGFVLCLEEKTNFDLFVFTSELRVLELFIVTVQYQGRVVFHQGTRRLQIQGSDPLPGAGCHLVCVRRT